MPSPFQPDFPSISRRSCLKIGSLALGGLSLSDLLAIRATNAAAGQTQVDTSVILVWLQGGASHIDTYDPKPEAPAEIRGEFSPIQSAISGMDLCEHLPMHAQVADRFNLVRSISHDATDHPGGAWRILTGRRPANISDNETKFPSIETIVAKEREFHTSGIPASISNTRRRIGKGAAYLGAKYNPFLVDEDPNLPTFSVQNLSALPELAGRMSDRSRLLGSLDQFRRKLDLSGAMEAMDQYSQQAVDLVSSERARRAFDIQQEPASIRDRYGRSEWGQRLLLARRLIEAGCSFVNVELHGWDDHVDSGMIFDNMRRRLPMYDQAVSGLIEDVYARGLDRNVMIVVGGEFGRTPILSKRPSRVARIGRDHWPSAMSFLVSGGGMKTGQLIGSTDSQGGAPKENPLDPNDLLATIYSFLGIDPERSYPDRSGRPMPILPHGRPIAELS